jgi:hypothetical protein
MRQYNHLVRPELESIMMKVISIGKLKFYLESIVVLMVGILINAQYFT